MTEVAVIGAGVIGLACALRLAAEGHSVALLDLQAPGSGASSGNAGTVAGYAILPVGTPATLRAIPSLLFDRRSPFALHRGSLLGLMPWLARFLCQSLPRPARRNAAALAALLADAAPRWKALAAEAGAGRLLRETGCLYLHATPAALKGAAADAAARRALGAAAEVIDAARLAALEPGLPPFAGATLFPEALSFTDPGALMARLHAACLRAGVEVVATRIDEIERVPVGLLLKGPGYLRTFRRAVIAAGARSRGLAAQAGDRVPLDTERGYHLEWDMGTPRLNRPSCPVALGFYLSPMAGRLRAAGTVELGGLDAPPSPHRLARLEEGARAVFPDLGPPDRSWMGLRPSLPDSLPVLGPSRGGANVIHAFGHGHLGLTLAPVTADAVAAWIAGRDPGPAFHACRPQRF
jgi:D-hydroxyproline dehydrogenase